MTGQVARLSATIEELERELAELKALRDALAKASAVRLTRRAMAEAEGGR